MRIEISAVRMKRIVERCPSCGVEHDHEVHECEACGNEVRYWCRTHSRQIGWLESPWCVRCEEEEARREGRPRRPAPAPPVVAPAPVSVTPPAVAASDAPSEGVAAVLKARLKEAAEKPRTPPAAPPVAMPPAAAAPVPEAPAARAPEPRREPEKARPPRRGLGVRLYEALLTVMMTAIVGVLVGVVWGGVQGYRLSGDVPLEAAASGAFGGMVGLGMGVLIAAAFFPRSANPPG